MEGVRGFFFIVRDSLFLYGFYVVCIELVLREEFSLLIFKLIVFGKLRE